MQMLVLSVIRSRDLCQKTGDHLDDVLDGHATNLILRSLIATLKPVLGRSMHIAVGQSLDVSQVTHFDALWRG